MQNLALGVLEEKKASAEDDESSSSEDESSEAEDSSKPDISMSNEASHEASDNDKSTSESTSIPPLITKAKPGKKPLIEEMS